MSMQHLPEETSRLPFIWSSPQHKKFQMNREAWKGILFYHEMKSKRWAYTKRNLSSKCSFSSKNPSPKSKFCEREQVLCLHNFFRVKKRSEENSNFCIRSTRLLFAVSEVVLVAIMWFINMPRPVQHMESWLPSQLSRKLCKPVCIFTTLAHLLSLAGLTLR